MRHGSVVLGTLLLCMTTTDLAAASKVEHSFREQIEALGIRRVEIEVPPSEIEIRNGSTDTIVVEGTVIREYGREADRAPVQEIVDAISMAIETKASRATIKPSYGKKASSRWARRDSQYKLLIHVPVGTHVEVRQNAGEVTMNGEFGDIDVGMRFGDVQITVPKSSVSEIHAKTKIGEVQTDLGDRVLNNAGIFPRSVHYKNEAGAHELRASLHIGEISITLN